MRKYPIYITNSEDSRLISFLSYLRDYYDEYIDITFEDVKWDFKVEIIDAYQKLVISDHSNELLSLDINSDIENYKEKISEILKPEVYYNIYSIYSFKGGVGKSTFASSLKRVLDNRGSDTLIIDYDIFTGNISERLNMSKVLYQLSTKKEDDLDLDIKDGYIEGFINPKDFNFFKKESMERLIKYIATEKRYENIVIVLPRYINEGVIKSLKMSSKIIVVSDYERYQPKEFIKNMKIAEGCGVDRDKVISIVNKSRDFEFVGEDCFNISKSENGDTNVIDRAVFKLLNYL